jgi:endonuclease/exonuclease/phosphatase family metal-dependent hydrolase
MWGHGVNSKTLGVGVIVLVVGALVAWFMVVSRGRASNFLDPLGPVFTGPLPSQGPPGPGAVSTAGTGRFSVVSFNVHYGYKSADIVPTLRENGMADADVLLLQESNDRVAREVAAALGLAWVYYPATVHPTSRDLFGVAVLSRWPITAHRKILLPDHSYFDAARKAAMVAVVEIAGVPVQVVSVHLQSGMLGRGYSTQLRSLLGCVTRDDCEGSPSPSPLPRAKALVIGGDFNTWNSGLVGRLAAAMSTASLEPVEGILGTFTKSPEEATGKYTFDYFFSTPGLKSGPGRVGLVRTGSDHFPIEAVFKIP